MGAACESCGHGGLRRGARFCPRCGAPLSTQCAPEPAVASEGSGRPSLGATERSFKTDLARVLGLVGALTLLNVIYAIANYGEREIPPHSRLWLAVAASAVILAAAHAEQDAIMALLSARGLKPSMLWMVPAGFLFILAFMSLYATVLSRFGVVVGDLGDGLRRAGWPLWGSLMLLSAQPAIFEELAFRGTVLTRLSRMLSPTEALIVQAALFAIAHMLPLMFISHFVMGVVLGALRQWSHSLYPSMLLHALWNAWVLLYMTG